MGRKLLIADSRQFNPDPACRTDVRRPVEFFRISFDQCRLHSNCDWHRHGDMTIVVVIDRTHRKHPLFYKESRFAVGEFFPGFRQRQTKTAHALDVFSGTSSGHESRSASMLSQSCDRFTKRAGKQAVWLMA